MPHTPGPWVWKGEDYRGGWGWQLLVGPAGEGILCGEGKDGPYKHLLAGMPIESKYCETGFNADTDSAPCVHVRLEDARLIAAAPDLLAACKMLDAACIGDPDEPVLAEALILARAAIALAEKLDA
jgi:hypothetical protein